MINGLVDKGNSVIVIEHNLDVIKTSDWIIDMGPEGGSGGGTVVAQGTPEEVAAHPTSYTGQFLRRLVDARGPGSGPARAAAEGRRGELRPAGCQPAARASRSSRRGPSARARVVPCRRPSPRATPGWGLRALRPARPGRVLLQRHLVALPRLQHRLDDPPQLLGLVAPDGQRRVALQDLLEQQAVGRQLLGGERRCRAPTRSRSKGSPSPLRFSSQGDRVGGEGEAQDVRAVPVVERLVRHRPEVHGDLPPLLPDRLAGAQPERRARPPPVRRRGR